jgi:metallophosphoesterase (TIGR03768 family)
MVWRNSHLPAPRMLVHRDFYERKNRPLRSCEELACVLLQKKLSALQVTTAMKTLLAEDEPHKGTEWKEHTMTSRKDLKSEYNSSPAEGVPADSGLTRRDFMKYSAGAFFSWSLLSACGNSGSGTRVVDWPIADEVYTTAELEILPVALPPGTLPISTNQISQYAQYGYSACQTGAGLSHQLRAELAPGYDPNATSAARLLSFFTISDIHIADKESPAQPLYIGWSSAFGSQMTQAYSPVILSTTQVLDAAIQTVNALHEETPFDFGISLGDDANNTQYNELRWFIDVMDGQFITPSSGADDGAGSIDYQKAFKSAGLNPEIPWYQAIGNHDQFWMGSYLEDEKTLQAHISNTVLNMENNADPASDAVDNWGCYMGVVDGTTPYGDVIKAGPQGGFSIPPTVAPDPDRHSLSTLTSSTQEWMREFFDTTTTPVGHGFTQTNLDNDFACYSFMPKSDIPIKIIVLDDTCKGPGSPNYAEGYLDQTRIDWLTSELQEGQDNNKLMIIAAHIPVNPQTYLVDDGTHMPVFLSPTDAQMIALLGNYPNLILWIAGHRHVNTVSPQPYNASDLSDHPENSFWEVETASLRDFPQQFRTFDIRRNSDNTISIIITDVDPAVTEGSPAAKSRGYAIGAARVFGTYPVSDTTSHAYNAVLVKQLTPAMQAVIADCGTLMN